MLPDRTVGRAAVTDTTPSLRGSVGGLSYGGADDLESEVMTSMVRFLHTADWQIGMTRRYLSAEAQPRFTAARAEVVRRLGAVAAEQGCSFVVVAGDVFEHAQLTPQTLRRALEALRAVPVPVYLLPGNHDHLGPASIWASPILREELPSHVHVLDRPGLHEVAPGVQVVAAPWTCLLYTSPSPRD